MTTTQFRKYSTDVREMTEAWAFVMTYVDEFTRPSVAIQSYEVHGEDGALAYAVAVYGDIKVDTPDGGRHDTGAGG